MPSERPTSRRDPSFKRATEPAEPVRAPDAARFSGTPREVARKRREYEEALARAEPLPGEIEGAQPTRRKARNRAEPALQAPLLGEAAPAPAPRRGERRRSAQVPVPSAAVGLRDTQAPQTRQGSQARTPKTAGHLNEPRFGAQAGVVGSTPTRRPGRQVRQPPVDVFDQGENLVLEFEMPGVAKKQVKIVGRPRGITVSATAKPRKDDEALLQGERGEIHYERDVRLGMEIETDEAEARFRNGILIIEVPKKNPKKGAKRIKVKD